MPKTTWKTIVGKEIKIMLLSLTQSNQFMRNSTPNTFSESARKESGIGAGVSHSSKVKILILKSV